jgi:hypothetical protein
MATRAKKTVDAAGATPVAKQKVPTKTTAPRRRAPAQSRVAAAAESAVTAAATPATTMAAADVPAAPALRHQMIEEAAYARFIARGHQHGYSMLDWLAAEAEIDRRLAGTG